MPGAKTDHLGVLVFKVSTVIYTDWECVRQQNWLPANAHTQCSYCVSHTLRGCWVTQLNPCECPLQCLYCVYALRVYQGNKIHLLGMPSFNVSIAFHMLWEGAVAENGFPGSGHIQCFYCSCFERILGNKADSLGVPMFIFYCVLHAFRGCWVTKLIPWVCPHSTYLLRFTRFERMPVTKLLPWECQHWTFLLCFTSFERMQDHKIDFVGVPTCNVSVVFYTFWEDAR